MDEFRVLLEATLLRYGYESSNEHASDDEIVQMIREMGDRITYLEEQLGMLG